MFKILNIFSLSFIHSILLFAVIDIFRYPPLGIRDLRVIRNRIRGHLPKIRRFLINSNSESLMT